MGEKSEITVRSIDGDESQEEGMITFRITVHAQTTALRSSTGAPHGSHVSLRKNWQLKVSLTKRLFGKIESSYHKLTKTMLFNSQL